MYRFFTSCKKYTIENVTRMKYLKPNTKNTLNVDSQKYIYIFIFIYNIFQMRTFSFRSNFILSEKVCIFKKSFPESESLSFFICRFRGGGKSNSFCQTQTLFSKGLSSFQVGGCDQLKQKLYYEYPCSARQRAAHLSRLLGRQLNRP